MSKHTADLKWVFPVLLSTSIAVFIIFIPPENQIVITLLILLVSLLCYFLLNYFLQKKITLIFSIFVFLALLLLSLKLLDLINSILLLSLFVGIVTLLK
ncbi:hypothetical protein A2954_03710 [Candidatus Roizmanbacteria bacterium RIFCSPLOWO2_01_FULL_37_12]|uniref:Uncharacterized protein n=1 Tax=Candidatus Roizmanbacteria bacterium RIFCSPLOWO2_01_FULL_37_12 TaxID=1802056 RepID=A0A1F7IEM3_9BACT|nr:MAG: hypothetical protein A3D76_04985 [Candidatus Roizmanbacteria bacterium RIFCSPHIGHO2_02_FULL_37_9b]OGK41795.1 MAG: hypothetical protein A2954_03710 [Candidatus Roizmanbacteria bacterium RIFCSPLOWO2_01_FULL_37_12]